MSAFWGNWHETEKISSLGSISCRICPCAFVSERIWSRVEGVVGRFELQKDMILAAFQFVFVFVFVLSTNACFGDQGGSRHFKVLESLFKIMFCRLAPLRPRPPPGMSSPRPAWP